MFEQNTEHNPFLEVRVSLSTLCTACCADLPRHERRQYAPRCSTLTVCFAARLQGPKQWNLTIIMHCHIFHAHRLMPPVRSPLPTPHRCRTPAEMAFIWLKRRDATAGVWLCTAAAALLIFLLASEDAWQHMTWSATSQLVRWNGVVNTTARCGFPATSRTSPPSVDAPQAHSQHAPYMVPPLHGLPSDKWRPMIFMECVPGMPRGYAACLNYSNLLQSEEVVYPGGPAPDWINLPTQLCAVLA